MRGSALRWGMLAGLAGTWGLIAYNLSSVIDSPCRVLLFCGMETVWSIAGAYWVFQATKKKGGNNG